MISKKLTYKLINVVVILVMLSHITFMHNLFKNYVLCFGSDGHIQIENINDCEECTGLDILNTATSTENVTIQNLDCEDIPLDEHCFEENQFLSKKNILAITEIKSKVTTTTPNREVTFINLNTNPTNNHILESYTTVSLTI